MPIGYRKRQHLIAELVAIFLTSEVAEQSSGAGAPYSARRGQTGRIDAVNGLSREIELGFFTPEEALEKLKKLRKMPQKLGCFEFWQPVSAAAASVSFSEETYWILLLLFWQD